MAAGILHKFRRRRSISPFRNQPQSYVHHSSTPPEWPTSPAQVTPDVYITYPPEEDGLLTSVCVHRAVEHEPKRLRKLEGKHEVPASPPASAAPLYADLYEPSPGSPPAFRRSSLQAPEVILPKKPSEILRESAAKWRSINRQSAHKDVANQDDALMGADAPTAARAQRDGLQLLTHASSGREGSDGQALKSKTTLRYRASKVFKSFTNREGSHFGSGNAEKRISLSEGRANARSLHKRRNTLSDSPTAFNMLAQTATAHALPREPATSAETSPPPAARSSIEGRRRSSTLGHVDFTPRPMSPPLPPLPVSQDAEVGAIPSANDRVVVLEPPVEIVGTGAEQISDSSKGDTLQRKRGKNAFSNLFNIKGDKLFRSPPARPTEEPTPPVPAIPGDLAQAVADPGTPSSQKSAFASPVSITTPKNRKGNRFGRHRRRGTVGSISRVSAEITGSPSPKSATLRPDTPKTPTSPRSGPFSIVDLRKGFSVRGLGKNKGKLFSAKSSPRIGSPPPMRSFASEDHAETMPRRSKASRPPPLQSVELPRLSQDPAAPVHQVANASPVTIEFVEPLDTTGAALPSPTDSDGPATPMVDAQEETAPAAVIELDETKVPEVPGLTHTPPTSDENDQAPERTSSASEVTLLAEDPRFSSLSSPSTIPDLQLQLREPSTKTTNLDAHLRLDSLRFDDFSFDTNVF